MRTRAIILKKQNTHEYDQLVTCYTEEFGKLTAVAKSINKPTSIQSMHLDSLNLVDFDLINGKGVPIITGAQAESTHPNLKKNLPSLAVAYFFAEVIDKIAFDYQQDESLWQFISCLMSDLDRGEVNHKEFFNDKKLEFLGILGYAPNLDECVICSEKSGVNLIAYNAQAKGVVCKNCFLGGVEGIVVKDRNWLSDSVLNGIFESLAEKKLNSLNLLKYVLSPHTQ